MKRPVLMVIFALLLLGILAGCAPATAGSPSPSGTDQPTPLASATVAPPPPASASISASTASPTTSAPPEAAIPIDTVVATAVERLSLRRTPGTAGERMGFLELETVAYILEGPTEVDGLPWYRVTGLGLPYASGCVTTPPTEPITCPAFHGWAAGASEAGDPWLAATDPGDCPEPTIESVSEWGFTWRLICWSDEAVTFDAWWPELPQDAGLGRACPQESEPAGFLYCQSVNGLSASPEEGPVNRITLSIDPASGVSMPERGQWIRVTGQFDHPLAEACAELAADDQDPDDAVFACRLQFVPTSVEAVIEP